MLKTCSGRRFPPGEFIREELKRGWTQEDLAQIMGRPLRLVNELINAKKQITPDTARGLADAFGTDALYWMTPDSSYRLSGTQAPDQAVSQRARLYERFPVREMMKRGWVEPSQSLDVIEHRVLQFFRVRTVAEKPAFAHAAKASEYKERTPLQWAWLFRAKQLSEAARVAPFDQSKLRAAISRLKTILVSPEEIFDKSPAFSPMPAFGSLWSNTCRGQKLMAPPSG